MRTLVGAMDEQPNDRLPDHITVNGITVTSNTMSPGALRSFMSACVEIQLKKGGPSCS